MTKDKRGRGRPRGTGLDDSATLAAMADLIVAEAGLRPTTALKRVVQGPGPSFIRRLQVKWRASEAQLLEAARLRRASSARASAPAHFRRRARAQSFAVDRAYADLGLGGFARRGQPEGHVERALRKANEQMHALLSGRESVADRELREARESFVEKRAREAAFGIEKIVAEAMGLGRLGSAFGTSQHHRASASLERLLGLDRGSLAMRAALGFDRASLEMRGSFRPDKGFF